MDRKAAGICKDCGNQIGADGTSSLCRSCTDKHHISSRKCPSRVREREASAIATAARRVKLERRAKLREAESYRLAKQRSSACRCGSPKGPVCPQCAAARERRAELHRERAAAYMRAYRSKHGRQYSEGNPERWHRLAAIRKASGLCYHCGKPSPAAQPLPGWRTGPQYCDDCRAYYANMNAKRRALGRLAIQKVEPLPGTAGRRLGRHRTGG